MPNTVPGPSGLPRVQRAALSMLTAWMGERYFRTFRLAEDAQDEFDAVLAQRERRIGVTIGVLWDGGSAPGAHDLESLVTADLEAAGDAAAYALWVPPGGDLPRQEPAISNLRLLITRGLNGLEAG